ncbi:MAG TPA: HD domain-containing phosphohydrolase [Symbiobacteriaceae bacterium]|jgi:diguanylate cyclase (GGDEF)-like protein/PAS domain S-box-containing protein
MRRGYAVFLTLLSLVAATILVFNSSMGSNDWVKMLELALFMIASTRIRFIELSAGSLDFQGASIVAAFIIAGPQLALWAVVIATLAHTLIRGSQPGDAVFNISSQVVTAFVAFQLHGLLGGGWGPAFIGSTAAPVIALVTAGAFMLVNALLLASYLHVKGSAHFRTVLGMILDTAGIRAYMTTMVVGIILAFAFLAGGLPWAAVVAGLAYLIFITLLGYFTALQEAQSRAQQVEAVLNATQGALIMADQKGVVQMANRQVGVLLGIEPETLVGRPETDVPVLQQIRRQLGTLAPDQGIQQVLELTQGPARFVHWYRTSIQSPQGEAQGHIEVLTDVTPLKQAQEDLRKLYDSMVSALTAAIDARDSYTHGHSGRVSQYAEAIGRQLGLSPTDLERIHYSGLLHDIGKLGIDDHVLRKRGKLSPSETAIMMQHPDIGAAVLQRANVLTELLPGVRWHHEWYGGGGYPDGLKGLDIPLDARIIGVADALDAMTSDRPYRPAMTLEEALRRLQANAGIQFDPDAVVAALAALDAGNLRVTTAAERRPEAEFPQEEGIIRPVHGKELAVFYKLSQDDHSGSDLDVLLQRYLQIFHESVGPDTYLVYLLNPATGELELKCTAGLDHEAGGSTRTGSPMEETLRIGQPSLISDTATLEGYCPMASSTRSEAIIPLIAQEDRLGVMVVEAPSPSHFGKADMHLLAALGQHLASAVKLVRYHERLTFASTHDSLTDVSNHRYFYERLTEEVGRARRTNGNVSVLLVDVNGLKAINDAYGHLAGDEVLREYGRSLKAHVRPGDTVARYGGDEFAIILPEIDRTEAAGLAARLVSTLCPTFSWAGRTLAMPGVAWGVAAYPEDGLRESDLVLTADKSLRQGRERSLRDGAE